MGLVIEAVAGDRERSELGEHHERGLAIFREIGDRKGEGMATGNLGSVFQALGRYEEAREHHERGLAIVLEDAPILLVLPPRRSPP